MKGLRPPEEKNEQRAPLRLAATLAALAFLGIVACHLLLRDIVTGGVGGSVGGRDPSVSYGVDHRAQGPRRRLQDDAPPPPTYGDCPVAWPIKPPRKIQTTYAASYPGCGARMSWNLIEALTGLWTGDDWNTNNRGRDVVTVKTHYPHHAGRLVDWDEDIHRAFMIIRNPISAIPSFFNHIYEMKMHLPIHSQRAPVADWVGWRDKLLDNEIGLFRDFVRYWMTRFTDEHRIVMSYERLTDDITGGEEALRLTEFLGRGEGVVPMTKREDVPCVWHSVVKYKEHQQHQQQQLEPRHFDRRHRRLDPAHHDSQRSGTTERPYTKKQYEQITEMLRNLAEEFAGHQMLHDLLKQYEYEVVEAAKTQREKEKRISSETEGAPSPEGFMDAPPEEGGLPQQPPETAPNAPPRQRPPPGTTFDGRTFHIFQSSPARTGSTVLTNFLMGLFEPDADYAFMVNRGDMPIKQRNEKIDISATVVTKTHNTDLTMLYEEYKPMFSEVFFVSSSRGDDPNMRVSGEMCEYNNVLCLEYEELRFTNEEQLREVAKQLTYKFREKFAYFFDEGGVPAIVWDWPTAVERLKAMDAMSRELVPKPFEVSDHKFGVHGALQWD